MDTPPFVPFPAVGDAFIGRQGLVRNFRWRTEKNESLAVIGGSGLGKTSLVRTALQDLPDRAVLEVDLSLEPSRPIEPRQGAIVILDNLDSVPTPEIGPLLAGLRAAQPASVVATGGRRLWTLIDASGTLAGYSFRLFPLSVLLDGEAQRLIGGRTHHNLADWTGNHPYLVKLILHYLDEEEGRTLEEAIRLGRHQWEPFVRRLSDEIGEGSERRLLLFLIERGKPVNPLLAQAETGIPDIKPVADTLAYLGVISRWVRNEEATLFAGCRLLNDYLRTV